MERDEDPWAAWAQMHPLDGAAALLYLAILYFLLRPKRRERG